MEIKQSHKSSIFAYGLLVVVFVGVGVVYKLNSFSPEPQFSKAGEDEGHVHWPHETLPYQLTLVDSTTPVWKESMSSAVSDWQGHGVLSFRVVKSNDEPGTCYYYPEQISACVFNNSETPFIGFAEFLYYGNHILAAAYSLNDYYFDNPASQLSTPEWRNYMQCNYLGFSIGVDIKPLYDYEKPDSCMEGGSTFEAVMYKQHPDKEDVDRLVKYNDHKDFYPSSSVSSKVASLNARTGLGNWGRRLETSEDGSLSLYELDLGDGYFLKTAAFSTNGLDLNLKKK